MKKEIPLGIVLWSGKSLIDNKRIMLVANSIKKETHNRKTGNMIQTYILRKDIEPILARRLGEDKSICGDCKHKEQSTCYVNLCHGPVKVFNAYHDGQYKVFEESDIKYFKNRYIRIGTYGDPTAVPFEVWDKICSVSNGFTGYTHNWLNCDNRFKSICMASVDSIKGYMAEYEKAQSMGWRTFRVFADEELTVFDSLQENEFVCPASKEKGKLTDCNHCRACGGLSSKTVKSVAINIHGDSEQMGSLWRKIRFIKLMKAIKNKKKYRRNYKAERKALKLICKY